jgi:hypothetical protein
MVDTLKAVESQVQKMEGAPGIKAAQLDVVKKANRDDQIAAGKELLAFQSQLSADLGTPYDKLQVSFQQGLDKLAEYQKRGVDTSEVLFQMESGYADKANALREVDLQKVDAANAKKIEDEQKTLEQISNLRDQLTIQSVDGYDRQRVAAQISYEGQIEEIQRLNATNQISSQQQQQFSDLALKGYELQIDAIAHLQDAQKESQFWASRTGQIVQGSAQIISSSFTSAFMDLVNGVENGGKAVQKFFAGTLAGIGQMITQMIIFNAITGIFKGGVGLGAAGGGFTGDINSSFVSLAAAGGFFPRMMAGGGMQFTNGTTYLPNYNAITGEAGKELLAVLARPRMMQIGGMQAAVGDMEGKSMAVVPTSAIGGGGGTQRVIISMEDGLRAQLVQDGAKAGVEIMIENLGRKTPARDAVVQAAGVS